MFKVLILAVALVAFVSSAPAGEKVCAGCPREQDVNDPEFLKELNSVFATANSDKSIKKVTSHRTQVVAGVKHYVDFIANDDSTCSIVYLVQAWMEPTTQVLTNKCN